MIPASYYHVYNHANGRENLFLTPENYLYFLKRYKDLVEPVAVLYAWCLMPNHFHFLVRVRSAVELTQAYLNTRAQQLKRKEGVISVRYDNPPLHEIELSRFVVKSFSNLFNSYTQAFNRQNARKGSLFMQNMKRREIRGYESLCRLVRYIHANPVSHGFVANMTDWPYSSFLKWDAMPEEGPYKKALLDFFGDRDAFRHFHSIKDDDTGIWFGAEL